MIDLSLGITMPVVIGLGVYAVSKADISSLSASVEQKYKETSPAVRFALSALKYLAAIASSGFTRQILHNMMPGFIKDPVNNVLYKAMPCCKTKKLKNDIALQVETISRKAALEMAKEGLQKSHQENEEIRLKDLDNQNTLAL